MITIKIDKTAFEKREISEYLLNVARLVDEGYLMGEDWDMNGVEEINPDEI